MCQFITITKIASCLFISQHDYGNGEQALVRATATTRQRLPPGSVVRCRAYVLPSLLYRGTPHARTCMQPYSLEPTRLRGRHARKLDASDSRPLLIENKVSASHGLIASILINQEHSGTASGQSPPTATITRDAVLRALGEGTLERERERDR